MKKLVLPPAVQINKSAENTASKNHKFSLAINAAPCSLRYNHVN